MPTVTRTRTAPGRYLLSVNLENGRTRTYTARRAEIANPSARGGAYRTAWRVSFGGRVLRTVDTLADAERAVLTLAGE